MQSPDLLWVYAGAWTTGQWRPYRDRETGFESATASIQRKLQKIYEREHQFPWSEKPCSVEKFILTTTVQTKMDKFTPEQGFKADFFYQLLDHALVSVQSRFQQIEDWNRTVELLCRSDTLIKMHDTTLLQNIVFTSTRRWKTLETNELLTELSSFVQSFMGTVTWQQSEAFYNLQCPYVIELMTFIQICLLHRRLFWPPR